MNSNQTNQKRTKKPRIDEDHAGVTAPTPTSGTDTAKAQHARHNDPDGKLRNMMNVPLDIFAEVSWSVQKLPDTSFNPHILQVCLYLEPIDVRHLALASKRLWGILMTREARCIWNAVLSSIPGLPKCPTDLNEPHYVRFLFSTECDTTV